MKYVLSVLYGAVLIGLVYGMKLQYLKELGRLKGYEGKMKRVQAELRSLEQKRKRLQDEVRRLQGDPTTIEKILREQYAWRRIGSPPSLTYTLPPDLLIGSSSEGTKNPVQPEQPPKPQRPARPRR